MDNDDGANIMPVPWGRLKAWIEAQEQAEQSGYNSSPPSKAQIAAVSHVVDFMDEPELTVETIGKLDYVSELMREQHPSFFSFLKLPFSLSPTASKKKQLKQMNHGAPQSEQPNKKHQNLVADTSFREGMQSSPGVKRSLLHGSKT